MVGTYHATVSILRVLKSNIVQLYSLDQAEPCFTPTHARVLPLPSGACSRCAAASRRHHAYTDRELCMGSDAAAVDAALREADAVVKKLEFQFGMTMASCTGTRMVTCAVPHMVTCKVT